MCPCVLEIGVALRFAAVGWKDGIIPKLVKLLKKAHEECQYNRKLASRECAEDAEEIPPQSGNVYRNLEPTITLKYVLPCLSTNA